jgi:hypothetical protein
VNRFVSEGIEHEFFQRLVASAACDIGSIPDELNPVRSLDDEDWTDKHRGIPRSYSTRTKKAAAKRAPSRCVAKMVDLSWSCRN